MKKPGIILSIIIGTIMFIYIMSLISSQNVCSGVRSYECTSLQKKANDALLTTQSNESAKIIETSRIADNIVKKSTTQTTPVVKQITPTNNTQQAAATQQAQQEAAAAKLAAQQAAAKLATQQAAAKLAAEKLAAQQAAAATVTTTTRAS